MAKKYRSHDDHPYWETVKRLPTLRAKVEYTWENWNVQILATAFIIVLISSVLITNLTQNVPDYLTGAYINMLSVDESEDYQADYLDQVFLRDYLGYPETEKLSMPYSANMPLDLTEGSALAELNHNTITRLDAQIPSNELDYFVMTEDVVLWIHERYGAAFMDLRDFLTAEELELYADRLRYTRDGVPIAIDITDSTLLAEMCLTADKPVCFSWFAYVKNQDRMRPFFDFLMTTLP